jgi:hypothetical protein
MCIQGVIKMEVDKLISNYEPLSFEQLRKCIKDRTECFVFYVKEYHLVVIESLTIERYNDIVKVNGPTFRGCLNSSVIGFSKKHAKVLFLVDKLNEIYSKMNQLDKERSHINMELCGVEENVGDKKEVD